MQRHLEKLLDHADVVPAVNQIGLSPYNFRYRQSLVDFCREQDILPEAYSR